MNLIDIAKQFATEEACVNYLEAMRWPDGVRCLKCDGAHVSRYQTAETSREVRNRKTGAMETKRVPARFIYQCMDADCHHQFSVTTGTIFNDTHLSLEKWFNAVALMCNGKKGISAMQMQRDLRTAYKTAWYLNHRIRKAMAMVEEATQEPLTGTIEADETYIGGKWDKRRKRGKYEKAPVFGVVERGGRVRTHHMPKPNLSSKKIIEKIKGDVSINADGIYTDESRYYGTVAGCLKNHNHQSVNHIELEWVRGDVHTGTIDGYWGLLKRGIIGSFHKVSVKHLHRYLSEFQFRWNNREAEDMFPLVIAALVIGIAFPYAQLTAKTSQPEQPEAETSEDVPF
ncbi:MAG TPA: IS1595 family transposase [Bryobacteraceae bacterium]|nr:IS1595 family transposase [Bryobacteraceae bacterium]